MPAVPVDPPPPPTGLGEPPQDTAAASHIADRSSAAFDLGITDVTSNMRSNNDPLKGASNETDPKPRTATRMSTIDIMLRLWAPRTDQQILITATCASGCTGCLDSPAV
jgi:hypothetical protein